MKLYSNCPECDNEKVSQTIMPGEEEYVGLELHCTKCGFMYLAEFINGKCIKIEPKYIEGIAQG